MRYLVTATQDSDQFLFRDDLGVDSSQVEDLDLAELEAEGEHFAKAADEGVSADGRKEHERKLEAWVQVTGGILQVSWLIDLMKLELALFSSCLACRLGVVKALVKIELLQHHIEDLLEFLDLLDDLLGDLVLELQLIECVLVDKRELLRE